MTKVDSTAETAAQQALASKDTRRALAVLMETYGPAVYRFCRAAVGDRALAEDILQNVFVEAHEGLPRFAGRSTLLTWLLGIARHRCLDGAKARRRWYARFLAKEVDTADAAPPPDELMAHRTQTSAVLECLGDLPPHVRMAVVMRCQEGLSYEEMARLSRERAGTLQARVTRALPVLRACVEGKEAARERQA